MNFLVDCSNGRPDNEPIKTLSLRQADGTLLADVIDMMEVQDEEGTKAARESAWEQLRLVESMSAEQHRALHRLTNIE